MSITESNSGAIANPPKLPRTQILVTVPSGEVRIEDGADGAYLVFDCDCLDALPYCRAQCCGLRGTCVHPEEIEHAGYKVDWDEEMQRFVLHRDADSMCHYLNRESKTCDIYENRPQTCRDFHCSRGALMRGWKLANSVSRMPPQ